MQHLDLWQILARLGAAVVGGGLLGWERQLHEKTAGVRTHMMVSLGAATILVVGNQLVVSIDSAGGARQVDPTRLIEAVVGGIGFLGAGAIIQSRGSVRGLTTAASVWLSAAVGICCGLGQYVIAAVSTGLGIAILLFLKIAQEHVAESSEEKASPDDPL